MRRSVPLVLAAVLSPPLLAQPSPPLTGERKPMKALLADGYEIRSHAYFRCTSNPAQDEAMSCVSLVVQKGASFGACNFDRDKLHFPSGPLNATCVVFE